MKTDILTKYNNPEEYLKELVYQLNGDYPTSKFELVSHFDDWCIYTDNQEFIDDDNVSGVIENNFYKKFNHCLFCFRNFSDNLYKRRKYYE